MKEEIENLRHEMHELLDCIPVDYEKVLFISRKLDKLIAEYYKASDLNVKLIRAS